VRDFPENAPDEVLAAIARSSKASELIFGAGKSDVLRQVTITFGTVSGGRLSNLIADHATATADIRLPVGVSVAEIENRIKEIFARHPGVSLEITRRYEPSWTAPDHEIIRTLSRHCAARLGTQPVVNMRVGASDARQHGVPTMVCGLTSYNLGSSDEHVYVDELRALGETFALTAFDFPTAPAAS
jgi:succinyl-diaminopimelate desuccinylase